MRKIIFLTVWFCTSNIYSQSYFSTIEFTEYPVNYQGSALVDSSSLTFSFLGTVNDQTASTIFDLDLESLNITSINFLRYIFTRESPIFFENRYLVYADDLDRSPSASFLKIAQDGSLIDKVEYPEWEEDMGVRKMFHFGDDLYNVSIVKKEEFPKGLFILNKTDFDGSIQWQKTYGNEDTLKFTAFQDAALDEENNIWMGMGIGDYNRSGIYSRIVKMDTSGNIQCQYTDTLEPCATTDSNQEVILFSSGIIVNQTSLDKFFDEEYEANDWYSFPSKYTWLDHDANFIMDTIYNTHEDDEEFISGIVKGNGDYFFSYGRLYEWPDDTYGIIQKIGLDGTLHWTKRYKHPEYTDMDDRYIIEDLLELENGDLICLGEYRNNQEFRFGAWIMRLNEYGCRDGDDCGDIVLSSEDKVVEYNTESMLIAPNPNNGRFRITSELDITSYRIFSMDGRKVAETHLENEDSIDITNLSDGTYIVEVVIRDGKTKRQTILKVGM